MIFARATNNKKKLAEIQRILAELGHEAKTLRELGIECDVEENGTTFEENAEIKARRVARLCGMPTISDDSGLEVDILGGEPGVYSARYASTDGNNSDDEANNDKLLAKLEGVEKKDRTARFVSAVTLYVPATDDRAEICITERGTCEGWVGFERIGWDGFGYDPIFMVGDTSYRQRTSEEKDAISHRGKALRKLGDRIAELKF